MTDERDWLYIAFGVLIIAVLIASSVLGHHFVSLGVGQ